MPTLIEQILDELAQIQFGSVAALGPVSDADVEEDAGIKSSKIAFSQNEADTTTFPFRPAYHRLRENLSVMDAAPGNVAVADHSLDATPWFQETIEYAATRSVRSLRVPDHAPGSYYKCGSAEMVVTKPLNIVADHPLTTIGNQTGGLTSTQSLFKVDGAAFPNYEHFGLKRISLRPELGGTACRGVLLNRVAYPVFEDVLISNASVGVDITGDRGYASDWLRVRFKGCGKGMRFTNFTGGGNHNLQVTFTSCVDGFELSADSTISGAHFPVLGLEHNTGRPFRCEGNIHGLQIATGYAEQNTLLNGHTLGFVPAAGNVQRAISILGGIWDTDNEAYAFLFGGAGSVRTILVAGLEAEGYSGALARSYGNGVTGGQIGPNEVNAIPKATDGGGFTRVTVKGNEGNNGEVF